MNDAILSTKGGSKVGKTMSFKERKVELKSGSVETELESMEKKIDHMQILRRERKKEYLCVCVMSGVCV